MAQQERQEHAKVMIAERADIIASKKRAINELLPKLNELAKLYGDLELGAFTFDCLNDMVRNGAANIKRRYIDRELTEAAKFRIASIRDEVEKQARQFKTPFSERLKKFSRSLNSGDMDLIRYMSVTEAGEVVATPEDLARLEDETHVYITDPKQVEKFLIHQAITRLLNEFFDNGDGLPVCWWSMFPCVGGTFVMPDNGADYEGMLKQVAAEKGEPTTDTPEPDNMENPDSLNEAEAAQAPEPKQQNRQRGGMARGVSREITQTDHGAALRYGEHKISPEY